MKTLLIWASDAADRCLVRIELTEPFRKAAERVIGAATEAHKQNDDFWQASFWWDFEVYDQPDVTVFDFDNNRVVDVSPEMEVALGHTLRTEFCHLRVDRDGDVSFSFRPKHGGRDMETDCLDILKLYTAQVRGAQLSCSLYDVARGVIEAWTGSDAEDIGNEFFRGQMETIAHLLFTAKWPNSNGWMFGELSDALGKQARSVVRRMCGQQSGTPLIAHEVFATELVRAWTEHISAHGVEE